MTHTELKELAEATGFTPEQTRAIIEELGSITETNTYDHYGLRVLETKNGDYAIGTEEKADEATAEYIKNTLWAFNSDFIAGYAYVEGTRKEELKKAIELLRDNIYEEANPFIMAFIDNIDDFVAGAIQVDGRGHFLSSYDGWEIEAGDLVAYRIN
jgi:hypothetical protein